MIPKTNTLDSYSAEFFLCSGNTWDAVGGISTITDLGQADGQYHTIRINLMDTGFWDGGIHRIRIDFFNACEAGDIMFIKSVKLLPN